MSGGSFNYIYGKDSLELLSYEENRDQLEEIKKAICDGLFDGNYPEETSLTAADIEVVQQKLVQIEHIKDEIDS